MRGLGLFFSAGAAMVTLVAVLTAGVVSALAAVVPPVDVEVWHNRTAYIIVPTDTVAPYELRYQPGDSSPEYGDWPRADGGMPVPPFPWETIEGETPGLVYPVLKITRSSEPAHDSNMKRIIWEQIICGPDAGDSRQAPGCAGETDVIKDIPSALDLSQSEVLAKANNRAYLHYGELPNQDGWEIRTSLQQGILMAKERGLNVPAWAQQVDEENWDIQLGFVQDIRACLSVLRKKIKCKYDSQVCDPGNGIIPVQPGDFDVCWPDVPQIPEL